MSTNPKDKSIGDVVDTMHTELAKALLKRVKDGTASASDLNVARAFLKDNDVTVAGRGKSKPVDELAAVLPFEEQEQAASDQ